MHFKLIDLAESDEDSEQAALRELKEEIGIEVEVEFMTEILYQDKKSRLSLCL